MSVQFPRELRSYFQSTELKDNQELESLFKENEAVKQAFISWAQAHENVIAGTPCLFRAFEIANRGNLDWKVSNVFDKCVIDLVSEVLSKEDDEILATEVNGFPEGYLEHALLLFESGMIDKDQLLKLLCSHDTLGEYPLNFLSMSKLVPILKRWDFSEFRDFVSIGYERGCILTDPTFLKLNLDLMRNFNFEQLKELFSLESGGGTVLHHPCAFKEIIPLLKEFTSAQLVEICSIPDGEGSTLIHFEHVLEGDFRFWERLDFDQLKDLLAIQDCEGNIALTNIPVFKKIYPFLKQNFNESQLVEFLSIKNYFGSSAIHFPEILEELLPLLQEQTFKEHTKMLFSAQNNDGDTIFHFADLVEKILPILEGFDSSEILNFLCVQNREEGIPLHYSNTLEKVLPLLLKMDSTQLREIFYFQNDTGKTFFHYKSSCKVALPLLEKLPLAELVEIFSIQDSDGYTPLHCFGVKKITPFLKNFDEESFVKLFTLQDAYSQTLLHTSKIVEEAVPLLIERSSESLNHLFTIQNSDGNTPLHNSLSLTYVVPLFDKLQEDVWNIQNAAGSRPGEYPFLSWAWLKELAATKDLKVLSKIEYAQRANQLKKTIDNAWESFVFGSKEGQISEEYLDLEILGEIKRYSSKEVKEYIDCVLDRMVKKTAWRGTPKAEEVKKLRVFYSQMLRSFEDLVSCFKPENLKAQVGFLIGIAKAEMEERCAVAYQEEIAQASLMLKLDSAVDSKASLTQAELIFKSHAAACLLALIEEIAQNDYEGNSHATAQMRFSLGLSLAKDPDAMITPEDCREAIFNDYETTKYISKFKESFNASDKEFLEEWLYALTPETFGEEFFQKQKKIKDEEEIIIESSEKVLKSITSNETIVQLFQSPQWGALKLPSLEKKDLDEAVFNQLSKALTLQDIEEAEAMHYESSAVNRATMIKLQDTVNTSKKLESSWDEKQKTEYTDLLKTKQALQRSIMDQKSKFINMKHLAEARVKLKHLIDGLELSISVEDFEKILDEKRNFDGKMLKVAKDQEINFKAGESGLPSKALERARRQAYAAQFLDEEGLNEEGATFILKKYQVLISIR